MQLTINRNLSFALGMLLSLPTVYFIIISFLKFQWEYDYLYNAAEPLLQSAGLNESLGLNINLLLLFGPLLALALNLMSILKVDWFNDRNVFSVKVFIEKHWWNMMIILVSALSLLMLFIYGLAENCNC